MADITNELNAISTAMHGSDVRTAIHNGLQKINNDIIDSGEFVIDSNSSSNEAMSLDTANASIGTAGYLTIRKVGKVVSINGFRVNINGGGTWSYQQKSFANILNEDMKPNRIMIFPISLPTIENSNGVSAQACIVLDTNGRIDVKNDLMTQINMMAFTATYFVD